MKENPFKPGQLEATVARQTPTAKIYQYKPLRFLARAIAVLMTCYLFVMLLVAALSWFSFSSQIVDSSPLSQLVYDRILAGAIAYGVFFIGLTIAVCMFMYRANANVRALGATELIFSIFSISKFV